MNAEQNSLAPSGLAIFLSLVAVGISVYSVFKAPIDVSDLEKPAGLTSTAIHEDEITPKENTPLGDGKALDSPATVRPPSTSKPTVMLPTISAPATREELEKEAIFLVEALMSALPDQPLAMHVAAILYAQLHRTEEAEELWQKCIRIDPTVEPYYLNLAANALDRGDSELALMTLQDAVSRGMKSPDILHHLGLALTNQGQAKEAIEVLQEALQLSPDSPGHWMVLGQAQLKAGEVEAAEESLLKALNMGASSRSLFFALANTSMRLGKKEAAAEFREKYNAFEKEETLDGEARYQALSESEARRIAISVYSEAAAVYKTAGLFGRAELCLLRILALDHENLSACNELAEVYQSQQRSADEMIVWRRVVELNPFALLNYLKMAKAADDSGDAEAAEAAIKRAISLAPQMVTGYVAMAEFLMENEQFAKSQFYIEQAMLLAPSREGFQMLAKVCRLQGKEAEAQAAEAQLSRFTPPTPTK
ncbi:MAG: tetratricopeptide repeat protein [Planctomycetales bacterium]|nr:tetratricopeptide repeat protein [Planctomycetales bacterium]